jgi:hypothetical protein
MIDREKSPKSTPNFDPLFTNRPARNRNQSEPALGDPIPGNSQIAPRSCQFAGRPERPDPRENMCSNSLRAGDYAKGSNLEQS